MTTVWFGILGPLEVRVNGRPITLYGPRQENILAALLLDADRVVTVDQLIDVVWEEPPASARRQVQDLVTRLRRTLVSAGAATDLITTQRAGYLLRPDDGGLDARVFTDLAATAREIARADTAAAVAGFREALSLWRGGALAGIRGRAFETVAEAWQERRLAVVEECLALELSLGRHRQITVEALALVEQHPFREPLVGILMRALCDAGRLADALDAYRALRKRLADELGLDPGADLQRLHDTLLRSEYELGESPSPYPPDGSVSDPTVSAPASGQATARVVPAPEVGTVSTSGQVAALLPLDVYGFTGRAGELERLDGLLTAAGRQPTAVMVAVLSGTAGVGKSALAVHWAHRVRDRFPDGQLYVNLRGFDPGGTAMTPTEAVRAFLDALGVPATQIPATPQAQAGLYRSLLAGRRILIVADNARDAAQVRPLLPGAPGCLVVVTSRDQLTGLVAVEGAQALALDLLPAAEARELLARRLGSARVAVEPEATGQIIARCARLPLALAVVAARAAAHPHFPLAALAAELGAAHGGLDALDGGDPSTQVRAVFSWSYRTLSTGAARLFRHLGLHPGPDVGAGAAASLAGISLARVRPLLAELARAHLITEHAPGRYAFHDLLRAYAAELAHAQDLVPDRHAALHRLLDHYLHTAHAAASLLNPNWDPVAGPAAPAVVCEELSERGQAMAWFAAEHTVLLAVVAQAAATGFDTHAWQLAWSLADFLDLRGYWHDQAATQATALEAAHRLADRRAQAHSHRNLARSHMRFGGHEAAHTHLHHALGLYGELGDHVGQASAHGNLAGVLERQGRNREALDHAQQALDLFQIAGHRAGQARALNSVGWSHTLLGDHRQALVYCRRALMLFQELGDRLGQASIWHSLGYAHHHLGQHRQAVTCYQHALELFRQAGHRYGEAETLIHLGDIHHVIQEPEAARHSWRHALDILDQLGHSDADQVRAKLDRNRPDQVLP
ncbi:BTAD domain-containing putative transcriptional regulator [Streptosporangium sp. NPDC000396]|uniref:AfsR/SARP family transcriptional regulator n=1 Tax=Streptosporangium sp. NPDC000396 TaxID=3366185 RepID=UPI0036ACD732